VGYRHLDEGVALELRENPFYTESGGQVSDRGHIYGDGWVLAVDEVRRVAGAAAVIGRLEGAFTPGRVEAIVEAPLRRSTERNHTATHLLHAALRKVLGEHVFQQGSLVAPDRLRFDFSHTGPLKEDELLRIEQMVNEAIWENTDVCVVPMAYRDAIARGAMALFSEKYADVVRVIDIPGVSMELCGGTHVRTTGQIGLFRIVSEAGVAAGVRRIEAVTGEEAYARQLADRATLTQLATMLRTREENLVPRLALLLDEQRQLHKQLDRARASGGSDIVARLIAEAVAINGTKVIAAPVQVESLDEARSLGDRLRERMGSGVAVIAAQVADKGSLFAVSTDDLVARGVRADEVIREVAAAAGGKGGGRPHMAQAGVPEPARLPEALARVVDVVQSLLAGKER
jgi:alanyl-tRNA synthetase